MMLFFSKKRVDKEYERYTQSAGGSSRDTQARKQTKDKVACVYVSDKNQWEGEGAAVAYPHMYVCAARKFVYKKIYTTRRKTIGKSGKKCCRDFFLST
jgi:hypothetical protein